MLIYSLFFIIVIFASLSIYQNKKDSTKVLFFLMFIPYVLSFIRWETGTDWGSYYNIYLQSDTWNNNIYIEYGYKFINYACRLFTDSYTLLLFVLASFIFYFSFSIRNAEYPIICFLLYYSTTLGNIMFVRQSLAVAIIIFSYNYIRENKFKNFCICILGASFIHISSLIALPLYYIYHLRVKYKYLLIFLAGLALFSLFTSVNNSWLRNIPFLSEYIQIRINIYLDATEKGADAIYTYSTADVILRHIVKRTMFFIILILYCRQAAFEDLKFRGYLNIYLYSSCIYLLFVPYSINFTRLTTGLEIVDIFLFSYILTFVKKKSNVIFIFLFIVLFAFLKLQSNMGQYPEIFSSYKTIFS